MATQSDERLLALVREGHERAFEALVNRYRRPLLSYCRRLPLPEARAEDVLQQALLKTWIALRDGAEVRDLKAWLYRVVHNTAVNAVRDAAHDRELLADPTLRAGAGQADLERGLVLRDALAGVAALPSLQREVVVRTAVGGHSHERVARELGITDGAVRGLLYRARATLRTALTALTPPPLLALLAGRADQSGLAPERLGELAAGGGAAGLGGLLVKGGVAAITAGTLITGAAVVHIQGSAHPRARTLFAAVPHGAVGAASGSSAASTGVVSGQRSLSFATHGRPGRVRPGGRPHPHGGGLAGSPSALGAAPGVRRGGRYEPGSSRTRGVPTVTGSTTPEAAPQSDSTTTPNAGSSPGGGASGAPWLEAAMSFTGLGRVISRR